MTHVVAAIKGVVGKRLMYLQPKEAAQMRDLKTETWFRLSMMPYGEPICIQNLEIGVESGGLRAVVNTFVNNVRNVSQIPTFPAAMFNAGKVAQLAETMAFVMETGSPFNSSPIPAFAPFNIVSLRDKILAGGEPPIETPVPLTASVSHQELLTAYRMFGLRETLELLMSLHLVSAWTVFEAFIGDLWEAALNCHPIGLADLRGTNKKISIPPTRVQEFNFDLREKMGTLLRANFLFSGLDGAREAYQAAFNEQGIGVNNAVKDSSFDAVAALRHVIVHRAGKCDDEYIKNSKGLPVPQLQLGEQLNLDGELLLDRITAAMNASVQLIRSVDGWIVGHSPPQEILPE